MTEKRMTRSDLKANDCWNIESIYEDAAAWEKDLNEAIAKAEAFSEKKGHLTESGSALADALEEQSAFEQILESANGTNQVQQEIEQTAREASEELDEIGNSIDRITRCYDAMETQLARVNALGTKKSTVFEHIDNLITQIEPIAKS